MASLLGLFALLLACIGMAGVFAYYVQQRTPEIGIRMALGARAGEVVRLVLRAGVWPMLGGALIGFAGTIWTSRLLRSYLLGLSPLDPFAHAGVLAVLVVAALAATFLPARRATQVEPVVALRCGGFPDELLAKAEFLFDDLPQLVKEMSRIDEYLSQ